MMRRITALPLSIVAMVLLFLTPFFADGGQERQDLNILVARALADNPEIKAAEERLTMTEVKAKQVGVLEDPMRGCESAATSQARYCSAQRRSNGRT